MLKIKSAVIDYFVQVKFVISHALGYRISLVDLLIFKPWNLELVHTNK